MIILVAGAAGPTGRAVTRRFTEQGHTVIGVDRSGADGTLPVDLLDLEAVRELAGRIEAEHGRLDGIVHLVGGWRGSKTFAETSLDDWAFLHDLLIRTLQHVTLAFEPLLKASERGRFAIVSAKAAEHPTQGNAAYATAKAAAEAWTLAFADALKDTPATANILVVKALVHDGMRAAAPEKTFPGFTDVDDLAVAVERLWDTDANGTRVDLTG
ncbi:NAD(P)-dependent dehydrogenase (short-subunit alcohol dehydrogenase family) [Streptosporangium becharense]|uniref:NAD(P)-dependent dehydrogenase (Short-subunit alcohol dehydrogenase family) n=1 Tax=Streptosporangium becharense TaxID=1816182 RepID=A0A7W9MF79_9ACTN|nr:SDR family NAD(P)-dependent oxidoreductase [Streptosporangium becharense]MBB2911983.1 NAD(P)-dependent dehydrogenase (short-subunit alcohol dehydrogenase family) [Streptosporangium becharense]MBB5818530.1 NAD(P)-dependent dehydrogenase (short-subunit alcohol dehydrogenase family) [Streptosporangium becharense]